MRKLLIVLQVLGSLAAGLVLVAAVAMWSLSRKQYVFPDRDLPSHLIGRWDWTTSAHPCGDGAHVIAFSDDRKTMTISHPATKADTGWSATYDILSLSPSRLRGAIRGEKRLTDAGIPVVWDLVPFGPDEYHWQRTDWQAWAYTAGIIRCGTSDALAPGRRPTRNSS